MMKVKFKMNKPRTVDETLGYNFDCKSLLHCVKVPGDSKEASDYGCTIVINFNLVLKFKPYVFHPKKSLGDQRRASV